MPVIDNDPVKSAAVLLGRKGGSVKSEAKARAARRNGRRGGRPVTTTRKPQ